jgi:hypothetical protein
MTTSQYRLASKLVEMIHEDFQGFHPGYRDVHAQGRYYFAIFKATPEAKKLSVQYIYKVSLSQRLYAMDTAHLVS